MNDYAFHYGQHQQGHVYQWMSMANHSCKPNASVVPGYPGTLKALRDIAESEEVTITYGKEETKFRCRCETCEARRARYLLGMLSTNGSAVDFLRKRVRGFGNGRSSNESSDRAEVRSVGWAGTSTFRRMRRGERHSSSTEDGGPKRPAKNGGADDDEEASSLGQRMGVYIHDCKTGVSRWFGWVAPSSR